MAEMARPPRVVLLCDCEAVEGILLQRYGGGGSRMAVVFSVLCCLHLRFPVDAGSHLEVLGDYMSVVVWWVLRIGFGLVVSRLC